MSSWKSRINTMEQYEAISTYSFHIARPDLEEQLECALPSQYLNINFRQMQFDRSKFWEWIQIFFLKAQISNHRNSKKWANMKTKIISWERNWKSKNLNSLHPCKQIDIWVKAGAHFLLFKKKQETSKLTFNTKLPNGKVDTKTMGTFVRGLFL